MPLHGKIVVISRSGGDGTEFPLTATCLFGRKADCDIRIQLPHVSKEHCRIDLNENKEVILTNLSSINPTRVNGDALQQSERLKHGDVITIIDRSFRFEYPPAPTPKKKRSSLGGKTETFKVLQDQQVGDTAIAETGEKRISEVSTDPHLKDGANHDNIQRSLEKTVEMESKKDDSLLQSNTASPFGDLYQMIKKSLDVKTPRKSSASQLQTPCSRFCTPKPASVRMSDGKPVGFTEDKSTPKKDEAEVSTGAESVISGSSESVRKQGGSIQVPSTEIAGPRAEEVDRATEFEATSPQTRSISAASQKFTVCEVIEQVSAQTPKSPTRRRRSKEATPTKPAVTKEQEPAMTAPKTKPLQKTSPRNSGKAVKEAPKKRKSADLGADLPSQQTKKKRVSFGGYLSPELFDKRLPPDSPLCKGATPRRSLSLLRPKQSLLRRASVIGLLKETRKGSQNGKSSAKARTPSPKKSPSTKSASPKTTPGKKSPKSRPPSPKAASPGKKSPKAASPGKSPKSRSPSPKAASPGKSPKSRSPSPKAASPGKSPKSRSPSPKAASPGKKSPKTPSPAKKAPAKTPTVQGRFSVSRISTPSPVAEVNGATDQVPPLTVTPKIHMRRKSTSQKTPSHAKSATKLMQRSGISRASMKVSNSWANAVKFGQAKAQVVAPTNKKITQKAVKKAVSKLQTPARKVMGHVSTGHADSPVTIVVGRAHKQAVARPTGAAPKVVTNTAIFKKDMKMDEDLTGVSEMFKTPVNERKRRPLIEENSPTKTPAGGLGTSVVEPSLLNTPEGPGEMMVSPLSAACTVAGGYNSEAVQRLLPDERESSFVSDTSAFEVQSESSEQHDADLKTTSAATPKQKPEQQECLTGVKRIMNTPRQKAEPIEDLRGKILKTPKQKAEQAECLTGVKRIMNTPRQKAEPIEDIRGKLLITPKQKPEQPECLTGVKRVFQTPEQEAERPEELQGTLLKTPKAPEAVDVSVEDVKEVLETPAHVQESEDPPEMTNTKSYLTVCLTDINRIMKTPKEQSAPVEEKGDPIDDFGIERLAKSPTLGDNAPLEDIEGLQELIEEPLTDPTVELETNQDDEEMPAACGVDVATEQDTAHGEPQGEEPSDADDDVPMVDTAKEVSEVASDHLEVPNGHDDDTESLDVVETISQAAADQNILHEQPKVDAANEKLPEVETPAGTEVADIDPAAADPGHEKKPVRGRKAKTSAQDKQEAPEASEEPVPAPVRGRRGKKAEAAAPPAVRQTTRGRNAKTTESRDVELSVEDSGPRPSEAAVKPKRGRNAKKAPAAQVETVSEVVTETETPPEAESEESLPVGHKADDSAAPLEKAVLKPKRGRKTKQPEQSEQQDEPHVQTEDVAAADVAKADEQEVCSEQLEVLPGGTNENKSSEAMETVLHAPQTDSLPDEEAEVNAAVVQKKPVRGRRAKLVESKEEEDKQEAAEEPVVPAPIRGRRGKKMDATAPPAVRQTARTRTTKSQDGASDQPPAEIQAMPEISTEAASAPASLINTSQEKDSAQTEEAVKKPLRGRRAKPTAVKPEENEAESGEPQKPKPRGGRKTKPVSVEQDEVAEDTVVTTETKPPVRAKRGRNTKQDEEKMDKDGETTKPPQPVKKLRRTRKLEHDDAEPREEPQTTEVVVAEQADAPLAEPVTVSEQTAVATKPRRGGRKAKQDTESVTPVESTEVQEVAGVGSTDKPKRSRRGKQVAEDVGATTEHPEPELEAEPAAQVSKSSKARGAKTSVKNEISQAMPAKRARRGTAPPPEESNAESTVVVSESSTSVQPAKRGRRATAKPTTAEATMASEQANPSEELSGAVVEDRKMSKRSVRWKSELVVSDLPKGTPVKAVRGRKAKYGDQVDTESKKVSKDANETEEEALSDKVVEALPVKRARRGAKVADDKAESADKVNLKGVDAETQPKPRRGRTAKK